MPVTLTAPGSAESIEVLSATDVVAQVQERVPWPKFHANYLAKLTEAGKFPAPWIELGGRKGWLKQDLDTWIEERSVGQREKATEEAAALFGGLKGKELDKALAELKARITAGQ